MSRMHAEIDSLARRLHTHVTVAEAKAGSAMRNARISLPASTASTSCWPCISSRRRRTTSACCPMPHLSELAANDLLP